MSSIPRRGIPIPLEHLRWGRVAQGPAVAVHLQDVDVVGEPVQQRAGEALRT